MGYKTVRRSAFLYDKECGGGGDSASWAEWGGGDHGTSGSNPFHVESSWRFIELTIGGLNVIKCSLVKIMEFPSLKITFVNPHCKQYLHTFLTGPTAP